MEPPAERQRRQRFGSPSLNLDSSPRHESQTGVPVRFAPAFNVATSQSFFGILNGHP